VIPIGKTGEARPDQISGFALPGEVFCGTSHDAAAIFWKISTKAGNFSNGML